MIIGLFLNQCIWRQRKIFIRYHDGMILKWLTIHENFQQRAYNFALFILFF